MQLSWDPVSDESRAVAVAREIKHPASYRVAYVTPASDVHMSAASVASAQSYVASSTRRGEAAGGRQEQAFFTDGTKLALPSSEHTFEPLPPVALDPTAKPPREIWLVTGPSGSGKSWWIRAYAHNYRKLYPRNSVYLISSLQHDDTLDALDFLKRIDVAKLLSHPPKDVKTWAHSLVIIDDVEGLDPKQAEAVQRVQDMIASEGRHQSVSLIRASHLSTDYRRTRLLLAEVHGVVLFPQAGAHSQYTYLLEKYAGMGKKAVVGVLSTPTRWVAVHHTAPRYIMTASSLSLLS
jgi:hypothetical protein